MAILRSRSTQERVAHREAEYVERRLWHLFSSLDSDRRGVVSRHAALQALKSLLGIEDEPLDSVAMERLCPVSWCADELTYEQFCDLVHVAGAWSALKSSESVHIERRWATLSDPESNYTVDFPLKERTVDVTDDGDASPTPMYNVRMRQFKMEQKELRKEVYRMILRQQSRTQPAMKTPYPVQPQITQQQKQKPEQIEEDHLANHKDESGVTHENMQRDVAEQGTASSSTATKSQPPSVDSLDVRVEETEQAEQAMEERPVAQSTQEKPQVSSNASDIASEVHVKEGRSESFHDLSNSMKAWEIAKSLLAGGVAGATAKTVIAPLDRTKIIFQTTHRQFNAQNVVHELRRIVTEEGLPGLWRGHSATLARVMPYAGIQFVSFDYYKSVLMGENDRLTPIRRLFAGSMAGATSVIMTYPLDLMRARMSVQQAAHGGMRHNFRVVLQSDGLSGLYRGLSPTLVGILPYAGLAFGTFETLKIMVSQHHGTESITATQRFYCGVIAGFIAQSLTYPLDIVRRRMQTEGAHAGALPKREGRVYTGIVQTFRHVARHEGHRGLFKGLSMNWIKGPIAHGISFTTFDLLKKNFDIKQRASK